MTDVMHAPSHHEGDQHHGEINPAVDTAELEAIQAEMAPSSPAEVLDRFRSGLVGEAIAQGAGLEGPSITQSDIDKALELAEANAFSPEEARELVGEVSQLAKTAPDDEGLQKAFNRLKLLVYHRADVDPDTNINYLVPTRAPTPVPIYTDQFVQTEARRIAEPNQMELTWTGTPITVGPYSEKDVDNIPADGGLHITLRYGDDGWYVEGPHVDKKHKPEFYMIKPDQADLPAKPHEFGRDDFALPQVSRQHFTLTVNQPDHESPNKPPTITVTDLSLLGTVVGTENYPVPDEPYVPKHRKDIEHGE